MELPGRAPVSERASELERADRIRPIGITTYDHISCTIMMDYDRKNGPQSQFDSRDPRGGRSNQRAIYIIHGRHVLRWQRRRPGCTARAGPFRWQPTLQTGKYITYKRM
jgi:hypothetical protein